MENDKYVQLSLFDYNDDFAKFNSSNILDSQDKTLNKQNKIDAVVENLLNREPAPKDSPLCVSYGGGTNSTALLIWMVANNIKPDCIVFADTGNERPETYEFIELFSDWLISRNFPAIEIARYELEYTRVRKRLLVDFNYNFYKKLDILIIDAYWFIIENVLRQTYKYRSLGEECIIFKTVPSKVYGRGQCSVVWKIRPIRKYLIKKYPNCKVIRQVVGIHSEEKNRLLMSNGSMKDLENEFLGVIFRDEYPLIENNFNQAYCNALIQAVGLPHPIKSSCWFCPHKNLSEVLKIKNEYPELYELGCYMEANGMDLDRKGSIKGLGRKYSWNKIDELTDLETIYLESKLNNKGCSSCID